MNSEMTALVEELEKLRAEMPSTMVIEFDFAKAKLKGDAHHSNREAAQKIVRQIAARFLSLRQLKG